MRRFPLTVWLVLVICAFCCFGNVRETAADDCSKAEEIYNKSLRTRSPSMQKAMLLEVVRLCPTMARPHNNLGALYENAGDLVKAAEHYRKAIDSDPEFPHAYAGLGEVYLKQDQLLKAASMYRDFLDLTGQQQMLVKYPELKRFIPYIRKRLSECERSLQAQGAPTGGALLVSAKRIERELTRRGARSSGGGPNKIALQIHFDSGSDEISKESLPQMEEIGNALGSESLRSRRISIEGHTDSVSGREYNQRLSKRRADRVKDYLIRHLGIRSDRLVTRGFGEDRPVASNDTEEGRALNRRVELVNLGPMPGYQPVEPRPPVQAEPVPEEPPKPLKVIKIAIFKFEFFQANGHGGNLGQMVAQVLTTEAANSGAFRLAERELLDKVMKEHELGQSGLMEDNEAREIGRMVGADAILTGAVSKLGRDMRIDARLIDVETGNVIAAAGRDTTSDLRGISKACGDLMRDLVSRLSEV